MKNNNEYFRLTLENELGKRCKSNPKYSLRSFAKYLEIEPSYLSKLIRGKVPVGQKTVKKLAPKIGLTSEEIQKIETKYADGFNDLDTKIFDMISNWYHYAILELVNLNCFKPDIKWIARTLSIPLSLAQIAVKRLFDLGFLNEIEGKWVNISGNNTIANYKYTNVAFKNLQKGILEESIKALENVPYEKRSHTSMTMAIDKSRLDRAKELVKNFRREMSFLLEGTSQKDDVYQLQISLFPVTDTSNEKIHMQGEQNENY